MRTLSARAETWPLKEKFTISRDTRTAVDVVVVTLDDGEHTGRGECRPYPRYGESVDSVLAQIETVRAGILAGMSRESLQLALAPGAARNALDCALWDLEAKRRGCRAWELAGLAPPQPVATAYTLSLDEPAAMRAAAARQRARKLLKIKLGPEGSVERVRAVRAGAPDSRLIIDANEAWSAAELERCLPVFADLGVEMIEQPLAAGDDAALASLEPPIAIGADESCHHTGDVARLRDRYDVVNIKLDKTGGLTEALRLRQAALAAGLEVMVGCMLATSLAMAPATLLCAGARYVDLDGPLLLRSDRDRGLRYAGSEVFPPERALWG